MNIENVRRILKDKYGIIHTVVDIFPGTDPNATDEDIANAVNNSILELEKDIANGVTGLEYLDTDD